MYNFGNMNRDQHQGRDDEDLENDEPSSSGFDSLGLAFVTLLVVFIALAIWFG